jgi:hypothetical protein
MRRNAQLGDLAVGAVAGIVIGGKYGRHGFPWERVNGTP